jgi:hypothetical protein
MVLCCTNADTTVSYREDAGGTTSDLIDLFAMIAGTVLAQKVAARANFELNGSNAVM